MFEGAYINSGAMVIASRMLDNAANNLANVRTTGFKESIINQGSYSKVRGYQNINLPVYGNKARQFIAETLGTVPHMDASVIDKSNGPLIHTSNKLDLALKKGYFVVKTPGGVRMTRDGHFLINSENLLVNENGYPVLGKNYFKTGDFIHIRGKSFLIRSDGSVIDNGNKIDQLSIRQPPKVTPIGKNLFRGQLGNELNGNLISVGYLEGSNVSPIHEMVDMIEINRLFNRYEKVIDLYLNDIAQTDNRISRSV